MPGRPCESSSASRWLRIAVWVLSSKGSELSGFADVFKTLNWWWVPPAFVAEILSYVFFAGMQYELFKAGHLKPPWRPLVKLSFASQALTNSLPVGNAVATVYGFRWFRRFGADNTLAVWALAGTLVASMVSLSLVAVIGLGSGHQPGGVARLRARTHRRFRVRARARVAVRVRAAAARRRVGRAAHVGRHHGEAAGRHPAADLVDHVLDDRRPPSVVRDRTHHHVGHASTGCSTAHASP